MTVFSEFSSGALSTSSTSRVTSRSPIAASFSRSTSLPSKYHHVECRHRHRHFEFSAHAFCSHFFFVLQFFLCCSCFFKLPLRFISLAGPPLHSTTSCSAALQPPPLMSFINMDGARRSSSSVRPSSPTSQRRPWRRRTLQIKCFKFNYCVFISSLFLLDIVTT